RWMGTTKAGSRALAVAGASARPAAAATTMTTGGAGPRVAAVTTMTTGGAGPRVVAVTTMTTGAGPHVAAVTMKTTTRAVVVRAEARCIAMTTAGSKAPAAVGGDVRRGAAAMTA